MVCDCGSSNVNWSNKIKETYSRSKTNCEDELVLKDIVVAIHTDSHGDFALAPAIVVGEDDKFLDINLIHRSGTFSPGVVSKDKIQSVVILGEITDDEEAAEGFESEDEDIKSLINDLMATDDNVADEVTFDGMYL